MAHSCGCGYRGIPKKKYFCEPYVEQKECTKHQYQSSPWSHETSQSMQNSQDTTLFHWPTLITELCPFKYAAYTSLSPCISWYMSLVTILVSYTPRIFPNCKYLRTSDVTQRNTLMNVDQYMQKSEEKRHRVLLGTDMAPCTKENSPQGLQLTRIQKGSQWNYLKLCWSVISLSTVFQF